MCKHVGSVRIRLGVLSTGGGGGETGEKNKKKEQSSLEERFGPEAGLVSSCAKNS